MQCGLVARPPPPNYDLLRQAAIEHDLIRLKVASTCLQGRSRGGAQRGCRQDASRPANEQSLRWRERFQPAIARITLHPMILLRNRDAIFQSPWFSIA